MARVIRVGKKPFVKRKANEWEVKIWNLLKVYGFLIGQACLIF